MQRRSVGPVDPAVPGLQHIAAIESEVFDKLHNIVAHCCVCRLDDGSARTPGWVTIKTMGSAWIVQLKEPDEALSMSAVGQTLDDALALADLLLGSEKAPWEPDRWLKGQKGKVNKG